MRVKHCKGDSTRKDTIPAIGGKIGPFGREHGRLQNVGPGQEDRVFSSERNGMLHDYNESVVLIDNDDPKEKIWARYDTFKTD